MSREGVLIIILIGAMCIMAMKIKKNNDTIKKINKQIEKIREDNLMMSGTNIELMGFIMELRDDVDSMMDQNI